MFEPSKANWLGAVPVPTLNEQGKRQCPSVARSRTTLLEPELAIQTYVPSNTIPCGPDDLSLIMLKTFRTVPVLACSLVTVLSPKLETQMAAPSDTMPMGELPTV